MKINYRPEIDGLRAIAVSAVILYHCQIVILGQRPFKGGFIGVDIFFVISGYLITSLILKELITTGSFSFKNFYERRVRRILPALLVVILTSLPFAWMYLLPNSFIDFSKSIIYSLSFGSNFYFHFSGQQYGAESGLLKPFLHTWSLSVEEQFYILFPIVLLIIFKFFNKYLIYTFIFGFIISLGVADLTSKNSLSVSFYFIHTRMWELLAGSILAYFEIKQGQRSQNKLLNLIMPGIGLSLIIFTVVFFKLHFPHPSLYSLPAILGVCLIIWFSNSNELITKLLSTKVFVGVGLISYSLYLWHYPILAFVRINEIGDSNTSLVSLLIATTILSILTYYLIEKPARNKNLNFKILSSSLAICFFLSIIFSLNVVNKAGYKNRLPEILAKNLEQDIFQRNIFEDSWKFWHYLKNENGEYCFNNIERCRFNLSSNQKVYLVGDSHAGSLMYDLKNKTVDKNYQFITSVVGACSYYPGFNLIIPKTGKVDEKCTDKYFQNLKEILSKEKDSIIIFAARFPAHLTKLEFSQNINDKKVKWHRDYVSVGKYDDLQTSFRNEVLNLAKNNKIILMYPIPEIDFDPNKKIYLKWINRENKFSKDFNFEYITTSYKSYLRRVESSFELLNSIDGNNIYRVYPHTLFCNTTFKDKCMTHNDEIVFYIDNHHPSLKGSYLINELIMKEINKIELAF